MLKGAVWRCWRRVLVGAAGFLTIACGPSNPPLLLEEWEERALVFVPRDSVEFLRRVREESVMPAHIRARYLEDLANARQWPGACDIDELTHAVEGFTDNPAVAERIVQVAAATRFGCPYAAACRMSGGDGADPLWSEPLAKIVVDQYLWGFATAAQVEEWLAFYAEKTQEELDTYIPFSSQSSAREFLFDENITKEQAVPNCPGWEAAPLVAGTSRIRPID